MEKYKIGDREHPVLDYVSTEQMGTLPLVELPMMSDEQWNTLARENAVHNFFLEFSRSPESTEEAVEWQRERAEQIVRECEAAV